MVIISQIECDALDRGVFGGKYKHGTKETISTTPNEGYEFRSWTRKVGETVEENYSTDRSFSYTTTKEDVEFVAEYVKTSEELLKGHTLTIKASTDGLCDFDMESETLVLEDDAFNVTVTLKSDVVFEGWYMDGVYVSDALTYGTYMPNHDVELVAKVRYQPYNPNDPGNDLGYMDIAPEIPSGILGTPFELSPGSGCYVIGSDKLPHKFTFTDLWGGLTPSIQNFKASEYTKFVVEFAEPLQYYYNTPSKNSLDATEPTTWGTGSGMHANATEWTIDIAEDIYDLFVQNVQEENNPNSIIINRAYAINLEGNEVPISFSSGWGSKDEIIWGNDEPIISLNCILSRQWGGIEVSNDIIGEKGGKILRIYSNTSLKDKPLQWCIKTADGNDVWPSICVSDEDPYYAECAITDVVESIYLQYTAESISTALDIKAITWEIPPGLIGDVNQDGKVDVSDAVDLLEFYLKGETSELDMFICDVDRNSVIDVSDAVEILEIYINGK